MLVDFGSVPVQSEDTLTVLLTNDGGAPLELLSVTLVEGDRDLWSFIRSPAGDTIAGGAKVNLVVTFSPESVDVPVAGRIQIRSTDEREPSVFVALAGVGGPSQADNDEDGYTQADGDCDDGDPDTHPGATELCDGRDNDCNGSVPANEANEDNDGFRICDGDCDDGDRFVHPGADERCDDKDTDCDGYNPDRVDGDGDGFDLCEGDCDDAVATTHPGAFEACDDVDNDCNDLVDDQDADGDGHSLCSAAGDCDDDDPLAYPVVLDPDYTGTESGTDEEPYSTLATALANLDGVCNEVVLVAGDHELSTVLSSRMELNLRGVGTSETVITPPTGSPAFQVTGASVLSLRDLTISGSEATGDGGAIRIVSSTVQLDDVSISGNSTTGDGGGVSVASGTLILGSGVVFDGNSSLDDGGAIAVLSGTLVDDQGTVYSGNTAVRGGAVLLESAEFQIRGAQFQGNTASDTGGAVAMVGGAGSTLEASTLWSNTAINGGGGIAVTDLRDGVTTIRNLQIAACDGGSHSGGVFVTGNDAAFVLANNTIVDSVSAGEGGGIEVDALDSSGLVVIANAIGWSDGSSGLYVSGGAVATYNTVFASSDGTDFGGDVEVDIDGNESVNPAFTSFTSGGSPSTFDLAPTSTSPLVDSGPSDTGYNDLDGSQNDRGYTGGPGAAP